MRLSEVTNFEFKAKTKQRYLRFKMVSPDGARLFSPVKYTIS